MFSRADSHQRHRRRCAPWIASTLALLAAAGAAAKDETPRPPASPDGTVWGNQCLAESRGQSALGHACCANRRAQCLEACNTAECRGPTAECLETRTSCYDGCQRAYTLCMSIQPKRETVPGGARIPVADADHELTPAGGDDVRRPIGLEPTDPLQQTAPEQTN